MDRKKFSFKDTLHYWIVLIFWKSIKASLSLVEIRAKFIDIFISAAIGFILVFIGYSRISTNSLLELLIYFLIWLLLTFCIRLIGNLYLLPAKMNNDKEDEILNLRNELKEIGSNKTNIRLQIKPIKNDYGDRIDLEIRNKNTKEIMDCRARFKKLVVLSSIDKRAITFNDEDNVFYFKWLEEDVSSSLNPVCEKSISSYKNESILISEIKLTGWNDINFSIEFHSCKGDIHIVNSEEKNKNYSIIEVGVVIELIFDFEGETQKYLYSQGFRFEKKLVSFGQTYHSPFYDFNPFEWKDEDLL